MPAISAQVLLPFLILVFNFLRPFGITWGSERNARSEEKMPPYLSGGSGLDSFPQWSL